jgi:hypothetical protein
VEKWRLTITQLKKIWENMENTENMEVNYDSIRKNGKSLLEYNYNSIEIHWEKLESYNYNYTSLEKTMEKICW